MGDTFPDNFNAMDLRVSTRDLKQPTLTPLVQEFGRLCCYCTKDDPGKIPYILLGKKLAETLIAKRKNYATLFGGFDDRHKDAYIESGNRAKEAHADYKNTHKHMNRILLEAEPQIGKTGVYLCLVSLLRKLIEGQQDEEQEKFEETDDEETETDEIPKGTKAADWVRPFWKDMDKKLPVLKKKITSGKYASFFGTYVYGSRPEKILGTRDTSTKDRKTVSTCKAMSDKFRTFSKNAPLTSTRSDARCTRKDYVIQVCDVESKISVPTQPRFCPLFHKLHLDEQLLQKSNTRDEPSTHKDQPRLVTWIFTPSHGLCRRAYLNYNQSMLDSNGCPVQYVHVIVVRAAEYDSYVREWGLSHAVIALPLTLPGDEGVGAEGGGVGYARLFIQLLAEEYRLPAVFMLDDTIHSVRQVETRGQDDEEVVTEEDGKHSFVSIALFACLKDMELQLYGKDGNPPKDTGTFDAYPYGNVPRGTQESFTGPWAKYGIIGVLKNSQFVPTYKNPFRRTHVHSAILVNIEALSAKNLKYKPWQVWEDLDINNQCDEAGLWVVKYNKYVMRKVYISNWLPDYFEWTESTVMSHEPAPASKTNCHLALKKYISHCCPMKKMELVASKGSAPCDDVEKLIGKLSTQDHGYHLVVVNDEETSTTNIQNAVGEAYSVNDGKVALLLPSSVCRTYNLVRRKAFQMMLEKCIDGAFKFDCITSEDVNRKPVSLVLVYVQVQSDDAQGKQTEQTNPGEKRTISNREHGNSLSVQSQQTSSSDDSQGNIKGVNAQQNVEDAGERGLTTISARDPKGSISVPDQQPSASGNSQGVKQCQKCDTEISEVMDRNWMENDSSMKQVLAEESVDTARVLLCDMCVNVINDSRIKLTLDLKQRREACQKQREPNNISAPPKLSMRKNRLSLSGRRKAASSSPKPENAGVSSAASVTPSVVPQRLQTRPLVVQQQLQTRPSVVPQRLQTRPSVVPQQLQTRPLVEPQRLQTRPSVVPQRLQTRPSVVPQRLQTRPSVVPQRLQTRPSVVPQQVRVPHAHTFNVRRALPYGNHPQPAEPATPTNIDSVLEEDLFLSQDYH